MSLLDSRPHLSRWALLLEGRRGAKVVRLGYCVLNTQPVWYLGLSPRSHPLDRTSLWIWISKFDPSWYLAAEPFCSTSARSESPLCRCTADQKTKFLATQWSSPLGQRVACLWLRVELRTLTQHLGLRHGCSTKIGYRSSVLTHLQLHSFLVAVKGVEQRTNRLFWSWKETKWEVSTDYSFDDFYAWSFVSGVCNAFESKMGRGPLDDKAFRIKSNPPFSLTFSSFCQNGAR